MPKLMVKRDEVEARVNESLAMAMAIQETLDAREPWIPWNHQIPPEGLDTGLYELWLLLGGRGAGKTDAGAAYVDKMACASKIRIAIIAPTLGDAVEACVNGPSGLKAHNPQIRMIGGAGGLHVYWPNGSEAKLFGAHTPQDVDRLRAGGNRHLVWAEELMAWQHLQDAWDNMQFGLRLGEHPHVVATTTPRPHPLLKHLMHDEKTFLRHAKTSDNKKLPQARRDRLYRMYGGTRKGRQELEGEYLEDVEGALWTQAMLDHRVATAPDMVRVVVAVDPAGTHKTTSNLTGIAVAGKGVDGEYYLLRSEGIRVSPHIWVQRAIRLFDYFKADRIIGETNHGGDLVIEAIKREWKEVPFSNIHASRGKTVRAEPIASLYEQGRVHHVGPPERHAALEDQMVLFPILHESDDIIDATVYALSELSGERTGYEIYPM